MSTLTPAQLKHMKRLERWPFRLWCRPATFNAILAGYEKANEVARQRSYYADLFRCTTYQGEDYRVRLAGQRNWIRATQQMYEQAEMTGIQRSIGVPVEPDLLQITAA